MSTAAACIRNDLKAAGYSLKQFSIRTAKTGSVTVEIRDASIAKSAVAQLAAQHENISRDEGGEILSGGNVFVSVRYAREALEAAGAELTARLRCGERVFAGVHVDGEGPGALHTWHVWSNGDVGRHLRQISPFDGAALAEVLAERGELAAAARPAAQAPRCGSCKSHHDPHADC